MRQLASLRCLFPAHYIKSLSKMAVYAVGDIQGCYDPLRHALDQVGFDPSKDQLWCVGDLVNRGPHSLDVLRFISGLGESAVCVLGNHDLHLLALAFGYGRRSGKDSLQAVLDAPDSSELIYWLRYRPLLHWDAGLGFAMLHAGLPPQWSVVKALELAHEVEAVLRDEKAAPDYFAQMYGDQPACWSDDLGGISRLRFITNCFTRLRFCTPEGQLELREKGAPGSQTNPQAQPWFTLPDRQSLDTRIVFGHWSTLGYCAEHNVWALDTGCLWGGELTLLRIGASTPHRFSYACDPSQDPARFLSA